LTTTKNKEPEMTAKITINSGMCQKGQQLGCVRGQVYANIVDTSTRDNRNCFPEIYCTGPHDDCDLAEAECLEWAQANGVEIAGRFIPQINTGADADIRANR